MGADEPHEHQLFAGDRREVRAVDRDAPVDGDAAHRDLDLPCRANLKPSDALALRIWCVAFGAPESDGDLVVAFGERQGEGSWRAERPGALDEPSPGEVPNPYERGHVVRVPSWPRPAFEREAKLYGKRLLEDGFSYEE